MKNEFSIEYFKKNFKVKKFCEHIDYLIKEIKKGKFSIDEYDPNGIYYKQPPIYSFILYYTLLDKVEKLSTPIKLSKNSKGEDLKAFKKGQKFKVVFDYKHIDDAFVNEENNDFYQMILNYSEDGTLLDKISKNFKLIYHFPIEQRQYLIYSKFNKKYYHFAFALDDDRIPFNFVINSYKKKLTLKNFFDLIVDRFAKNEMIDPHNEIDEDEVFVDNDDKVTNYYESEKEKPGSLLSFKNRLIK